MAQLTAALEASFMTDFGLLAVYQSPSSDSSECRTYATSYPGNVTVFCGAKFAEVRARLELWDARPPAPGPEWEDVDEVPWESVIGGGRAHICGFDPPSDEGLDVGAFRAARMQVLAQGRHQYDVWDDEGEPEHYLFRLWPEPMPHPLDCAPRRIAGRLPWALQRTPWQRSVHSWDLAGWRLALNEVPAFRDLFQVIAVHGEPFTRSALAAALGRAYAGGAKWSSPVLRGPVGSVPDVAQVDTLAEVARAAGMTAIETYTDAFNALVRVGLLCRVPTTAGPRFVPNPVPEAAWRVLRTPTTRLQEYLSGQYADYGPVTDDLRHLARWSPGGTLSASVRRVAVRLAVPAAEVVGGLRGVAARNPEQLDLACDDVTASSSFNLTVPHLRPTVA